MLFVKRNFAPPLEQMSLKRKSLPLKLGRAGLTPLRLTGDGEARRGEGGKTIWYHANTRYTPTREVLIESIGSIKHTYHIHNTADIPVTDILIEGTGDIKHALHIRNAADIPAADILIEGCLIYKHFKHIGNTAGAASSGDGVIRLNLGDRPFGIFSSTHCTASALCGTGTENGHPIAMEGKEQPTVIFAFSIYWRVARVTTIATLYITIALRATLAGGAVGAGIGRAAATATAASTTAGTLRKAKG